MMRDVTPFDDHNEELSWLKEPDPDEAAGAPVKTPPAKRAAATPSAAPNENSATTFGKGMAEIDLEMQPMGASSGAQASARQVTKKPLYKVWPSRSRFYCKGMLMTGGETEMGVTANCSIPNLCAWTCILAPCSVYFTWVFPHLLKQGIYAMPLATLAVFVLTTGFLLLTCCSDPGVIPRREVILATASADKLQSSLGYDVLAKSTVPLDGKGGAKHLPIDLTSRGYRWCRTCRIVRPPRASHCPDCDNCVLRYDHHCPFVNNCVGQRNYHFFFGFITSVMCLAIMVLPVLFWFLNSSSFEDTMKLLMNVSSGVLQPVFYILILAGSLAALAALLSFVLWSYHVFLIATKRTTKEYRKNLENIDEEPTLCAERGPRLYDPWAQVDPMDLIRTDEAPLQTPGTMCSSGCWGDD
mmetsp:Transcript_62245/g.179046  ORF Transcript_62245/g.179046 Transcript_62245/m.179046 type:complete len:412 (+) Transcript_62245:49-1284(+)